MNLLKSDTGPARIKLYKDIKKRKKKISLQSKILLNPIKGDTGPARIKLYKDIKEEKYDETEKD